MSTLNDTDLFIVERSGTQYQVRSDEMSTLNDTDLFIVERGGVQYKVAAENVSGVSGSLEEPVEVLTPFNGAGLSDGEIYNPLSSAIVTVGGAGVRVDETDLIQTVAALPDPAPYFATTDTAIDLFSVPDETVLTFISIAQGSRGADGCPGRENATPRGGRGGKAGGTGAIYFRQMTKAEYAAEFSTNTYTQKPINNFNGSELKAQGPVGVGPAVGNCGQYPGGAVGLDGVEMTGFDFTFLNSLFPGDLVFEAADNSELDTNLVGGTTPLAGKGGNQPITGGPFGGDTGEGGQGGNGGVNIEGSGIFSSVPLAPQGPGGGRPPNVPGNQSPSFGGYGAFGWGAGGAGGGGGAKHNDTLGGETTEPGAGADGAMGINIFVVGLPGTKLTFPSPKSFNAFNEGDVVQAPDVVITSISAANSEMVVDGGSWSGSDGSGDADGATFMSKSTNYDTALTCADSNQLANMIGPVTMANSEGVDSDPLVSALNIVGLSGSTLQVSGVSGVWQTGSHIKGSAITGSAPSPNSVVFTSMNAGSTPVSGTDASLLVRRWTLESSSSVDGPYTSVGVFEDYSANTTQDGATPWANKPTLQPNTFYKVKVQYASDNAEAIESTFNTFKTGDV